MARQRGQTWQADITVPKAAVAVYGARVRQDGFLCEEDCLTWEASAKKAIRLGQPLPSRSSAPMEAQMESLNEAFKKTWAEDWADSASAKNIRVNSQAMLDFFGPNRPVHEITEDLISDWVVALKSQGNANATINRKLAVLSKVLRGSVRRKKLLSVPEFRRQKEGAGRIRVVTPAEERALLDTCRLWGWNTMHDAILVLIDTGIRMGELLSFRWEHVQGKTLVLPADITKSGKPRGIPMTDRVIAAIKRRDKDGNIDRGKGPFTVDTYDSYRHRWDKLAAHHGLADDNEFVLHALRHTCASRLVQAGVEILVVKEWLGHSTVQVTMKYAHLAPKNLTAARDVLNGIVGGAAPIKPVIELPEDLRPDVLEMIRQLIAASTGKPVEA